MPNLFAPEFDELREHPGFVCRRARIGRQAGCGRIGDRGAETARMLAISTSGAPDLVIYPESGKVGAFERLPEGGGLYALFKHEDAVDYWEDEDPPS